MRSELQIFEDRDESPKTIHRQTTCIGEIMGKVQDNPQINAPQITDDLKADCTIDVAPQTVGNFISKAGFLYTCGPEEDRSKSL